MAYDSNLVRLLYLLTFVAQSAVLWSIFHRILQRKVLWLTIFLLYATVQLPFVYVLYELASRGGLDAKNQYFNINWLLEIGANSLIFGSLIQIMRTTLTDYTSVRKLATRIMIVAGVVFLTVAIFTTPYGNADYRVTRLLNIAVRSVRLFEVGLIVAFFALARYLALNFKNYQFGILLGYGLYAASDLAKAALAAEYGGGVGYKLMLLDAFSYIGMFVFWLYYILKRDPAAPTNSPGVGGDDLDAWKKTLDDVKRQGNSMN
jgi:hypothetical protein